MGGGAGPTNREKMGSPVLLLSSLQVSLSCLLAPLLSEYISQTLFVFLLKKEYFFYEQHFILMLRKQPDPIITLRRMELFAALSGDLSISQKNCTSFVLFLYYH